MDSRRYIEQLNRQDDIKAQFRAVGHLAEDLQDWPVMIALCRTACETDNERLRKLILGVLQGQAVVANQLFAHWALNNRLPTMRASALMNLSLMRCTTARGVVMQGLHDPDLLVRLAAGLNVGLYEDAEAQLAFDRFLQRHRSALRTADLRRGLAEIRRWVWNWFFAKHRRRHFKVRLRHAS